MTPTRDTGTVLNDWFEGLDVEDTDEAFFCLRTGAYSRKLLTSLRRVLAPATATRHGLDDPHTAAPGDPLSASVQTFLRQHLLAGETADLCAVQHPLPLQRRRTTTLRDVRGCRP
ncbi:hypothetical protein [Kineococcus sp. R86509]|uniref:hypothetical protein n=1 Tax=Kineococcus sp. R86509 TaxID=3093851 RepID=UPI0036D3124D